MKVSQDIPFQLSDISPTWLTGALRDNGVLTDTEKVVGLESRVVGEGAGFLGEVVILTLRYAPDGVAAPASIVLKIPTATKNRRLGQTMGVYEKEARFYSDLRHKIKVRTPKHYYSAADQIDDPDIILGRLETLHRFPLWLVAIIGLLINWLMGFMPRRYVLLIEDISRYRIGDQVKGCSNKEARQAIDCMVKLHSQFWESDELQALTWIAPVRLASKMMQIMYLPALGKFKKANPGLSRRQFALLDWLKVNAIELTEALSGQPRTLLHGDFRLDNLCFDDSTNEVLLFDWQTMQQGSPGADLAYFLSASVGPDEVDELIEYYRQGLKNNGIEISRERVRWEYNAGMMSMIHRLTPLFHQNQLEFGDGRGPEVMQIWIDRTFEKLENVDFENLLEQIPQT